MFETPTFQKPPIVEFVLGVQFSPLTRLSAGHFGLFWQELGEEWNSPEDGPPIQDQFELFDRPKWSHRFGAALRIEPGMPVGRFIVNHKDGDRLVQFQATRFHFNWRNKGDLKPSYKELISKFEAMFDLFQKFTAKVGLGDLVLNQWEVTYVDSFPQQDYWQTPADWSKFVPGLFGDLFSSPGMVLEHRAAEWSFEIVPKRGRVHIAAQPGRRDGESDSLLITTTARGPIGKGGVVTLREGLDLGHEMAVQSFLKMTSPDVQQQWGDVK